MPFSSNSTLVSAWSLLTYANVVEAQQVMPIELGDRAFETAFAACDLQTLGEFAGAQ
jgi:hypothetical protein